MLALDNELRHIVRYKQLSNFLYMFFSGEPHLTKWPYETKYARLGAVFAYQLRRLPYDSVLKARVSIPDFFTTRRNTMKYVLSHFPPQSAFSSYASSLTT